jgi:hypothetical protein
MSEIIFKSDEMVIKKISEKKIQIEKLVPVYVGEMLLETRKMKIGFIKREAQLYFDYKDDYYERIHFDGSFMRRLSQQYGTKLGTIFFSNRSGYSHAGFHLVQDLKSINIQNKELERELKLKQILE